MNRADRYFASFMMCQKNLAADKKGIELIQEGFGGGQWDIVDVDELHEVVRDMYGVALGAHHLSVDMETVPQATYGEEFTRTPYPVMLMYYETTFDGFAPYDTMLVVAEDEESACTVIVPYLRTDRSTHIWFPYMFRVQVNWNEDFIADGLRVREDYGNTSASRIAVAELPGVRINDAASGKMQEAASQIFHALDDVLVLINCANVELEPVIPTRLKIARAKKKDEQIERYSTIKLPGHHGTYKSTTGGSHASPAMHTRRGHYRRHRTDHGKRSWVRPCVVGDLGEGLIHGEYKV